MSQTDLSQRIEAVERGYEYMLAYAAQGFESTQQGGHEKELRQHLQAMDDALQGLNDSVVAVAGDVDGEAMESYLVFLQAVGQDASKAQGAIRLVQSRSGISSQLVDNLNASIHLRALLTDLFLVDEALNSI